MKTRIIQTRFWSDGYVSRLKPEGKLVFLYYLTNERVNIIHCYECPDSYVLNETGVSKGALRLLKATFERDEKIFFYKDYVHLLNAGKYETYSGNNDSAKTKLLEQMSSNVLAWYNSKNIAPLEGELEAPLEGTINHKSEIINQKEGVVKGKQLDDFTEEDFEEIAEKYQAPIAFVRSKYDDLCNWLGEKPTRARGRDLRMTLMAWVKRDAITLRKEESGKSKIAYVGEPIA